MVTLKASYKSIDTIVNCTISVIYTPLMQCSIKTHELALNAVILQCVVICCSSCTWQMHKTKNSRCQ